MVFVLAVYALVFLMRDVQVLALDDGLKMPARFVIYCGLQFAGAALMIACAGTSAAVSRAWTDRYFALTCVAIQIAEVLVAWSLRRLLSGRLRWIGWTLPSPVLLVALFALSSALHMSPQAAILLWLALVYAASRLLGRAGEAWEDADFTADFAMLTGCTALLFVPAGFF